MLQYFLPRRGISRCQSSTIRSNPCLVSKLNVPLGTSRYRFLHYEKHFFNYSPTKFLQLLPLSIRNVTKTVAVPARLPRPNSAQCYGPQCYQIHMARDRVTECFLHLSRLTFPRFESFVDVSQGAYDNRGTGDAQHGGYDSTDICLPS